MSASVTTLASLIKRVYPGNTPQNVAEREHAFFSMVKKSDDLIGTSLHIPTTYGLAASAGGPSLSTQITNASSSKSVNWTISRKVKYGAITITAEALYATRNDAGAFVRARKNEVDSLLMHMGQKIAHGLYRNSGGALGQVSSLDNGDGTDDVIQLINIDDAINFYEGMAICLSDADGSGTSDALRDSADAVYVRKVDLDLGEVFCSATLGGSAGNIATAISGATANDYIFPAMASTTAVRQWNFNGLAGWLPLTAPTSTSFNGVDRSVDVVRLGGHRLDNSSGRIDENIQTLSAMMARTGTSAKLACFMSHSKFANFVKLLGAKVEYSQHGTAEVGFKGIQVHSAAGMITVYPDSDCPSNRGYILDMSTWCLHTMRGAPHLVDDDGNVALRQSTSDGIELRARVWADLACTAPGRNGVFSM
jgi:hypothetical protein